MAIELHHLHPGHDDELLRLKSRIAELERMDTEHTLQIAKMNGYINHLEEELETSKRKEKESREFADPYTLYCEASADAAGGGTMNDDAEKLKGFLFRIIDEHKAACRKHPKFCDAIIDPTSSKSWIETERQIKLRNECGPGYADCILMEEMAEAFAAYEHGDKEHALQEFAQCGAVILRIMETIEKEMGK